MRTILLSTALIILGVMNGCTKDDQSSMMTGTTTPQVTVSPTDGASSVRLDAAITLTFAQPMDQSITERNVHLFSQKAMDDSACPMGILSMERGMMDSAMTDSMMMEHLINQHGSRGRFQWNANRTICQFQPDSMMMPDMPYMIHMGREMVQMMQNRMGGMETMGGHGTGMMSGDMIYHFSTMDTTGSGGGHDGHH